MWYDFQKQRNHHQETYMNLENYFLPHMGHAVTFPRPCPLLVAVVENYVSPLSLHVEASSIQHSLFEDSFCCALVLPGPLLWLVTEVAIAPFPRSLSIEFHTLFPLFWKFLAWSCTLLFHPLSLHVPLFTLAIHIHTKTSPIPLDPGPNVTKDPSKTFYFHDVLNCIF